jgi:type I restriction enzyme M protein
MASERITESLFKKEFELKNKDSEYILEPQSSKISSIKNLLKEASKSGVKESGKTYGGNPEFIITSKKFPNYVIVVECKSEIEYHISNDLNDFKNVKDYAVDGVCHYAKHLNKSYNVIAIAVSGTEVDNLKIDNYFFEKGNDDRLPLIDKDGMDLKSILSFDDYIDLIIYDIELEKDKLKDLTLFSKELHGFMYSHAKLTEEQKPLLVSGTLIALQKQSFLTNYDSYSADELPEQWRNSIKYQLNKSNIPTDKVNNMIIPYYQIENHPEMVKVSSKFPNGVLNELILRIKTNLIPLIKGHNGLDIMGQFYGEFLKYTAGDGKGLGIVLTPKHITDLFCDLVDLKPTDKVLDLCTGTGGFLISSMDYMIKKAIKQNPEQEDRLKSIKNIKENGLVGIEQQPHMFALAASNMILRGDGKSNLYQGSCFNKNIVKEVKKHKCNVGFINPPYSQKDKNELEFINHMLDCLIPGGIGVAIVPMSCGNSEKNNNKLKELILKNHTLVGTMSMPDKLFYPVGTITMILIFKAHIPHDKENESWFGYWKDDGYKVLKHTGRKDFGEWKNIKKEWLKSFKSNKIEIGKSAFEIVKSDEEWACECFLETNHKDLSEEVYIKEMQKYLSFKFLNQNIFKLQNISSDKFQTIDFEKNTEWKPYFIKDLFEINSASNYKNYIIDSSEKGKVPFITSSAVNNACYAFVDVEPKINGNTISVSKDGSVCNAFYQELPWCGNGHICSYNSNNKDFNKYHAFFIIPLINSERYRFNFGRSFKKEIMNETIINLPSKMNIETNKYEPDWAYMENYIKSLPYSKEL